jgi:predicted Zn-dependent protease with MMP-like domain
VIRREERDRFDRLLEKVIEELPPAIRARLEEAPVYVDDGPSPEVMREFGVEDPAELCGLHSGIPLTERSVADPGGHIETISLYRIGIVEAAGGWHRWKDEEGRTWGGIDRVREEIRITLLHEIGHHFGLDEEDLDRLGYA